MTRYKRKISLDKFNAYYDEQAKQSSPFLSETSKPVNGLLWTDPNVLSGNAAFQVRKRCTLPEKFNEILSKSEEPGKAKIISDNHQKYCALITPSLICLYLYNSSQLIIQIPLTDHNDTLPFVNIFCNKNKLSLSVINSKTGKVLYWNDVSESTALSYPLRLRSQTDEITTTCTLNNSKQKCLLVGTLMGDIHPLLFTKETIQIASNDNNNNSGVISYLSSFFIKRTCINSPAVVHKERIISIVNVLDTVYVLSENHIQVWTMNDDLQLELIANLSILKDLIKSISEHIPKNVSIENIRIEALDIDSKLKNELVLLSSYQLPVMGDYIQYAASTISIKNVHQHTEFRIKHTASAPFSAHQQSNPKLSISKSIAFIIFDSHVIAVSRNKKSAFEETIVLNDHVLCAKVENEGQDVDMESAIIYTMKNGILDFEIDIHKIQSPEVDGNIYAGYVSNTADSDLNLLQSKLEQAVLFGASQDTPLHFPLSVEQEDISTAVSKVLKELMENTTFLPLSLDAELRAEARYVFVNRIFKVLLDNNLTSLVDASLRFKLMNSAEMCYIGVYLLQEYNSIVDDAPLKQVWFEAIKNISSIESESNIKEFFNSKPNMSYQFLDEALNICFTVQEEEHRVHVVCKMIDIIMRVLECCRYFKDSFSPLYEIEDKDKVKSVYYPFNTLVTCFKKTKEYINNKHNNTKLVDKLYEMAEELLDCSAGDKQLDDGVPAIVMKAILSLGKPEFAMKLAQKYKDYSTIVNMSNDNANNGQDIIQRNLKWIELYGSTYLFHLFQYLADQGKDAEILKFDSKYPDQVAKFFLQHKLNITWKYYLQHKQYEKCLNAILHILPEEKQVKKRLELLTWAKLIMLKNEQHKASAKETFENSKIVDISTECEYENIQLQLINTFNKYLSRNGSTDKLNAIMDYFYVKSPFRTNADLERFSNAISQLLQGVSLDKRDFMFVLFHINCYKAIDENFITALKLARYTKDISDELQNMIWKEIYQRDVNKYQRNTCEPVMLETLTFRILNIAHKTKADIGDRVEIENIDKEEIQSDGFKQFIQQTSLFVTNHDNSALFQKAKQIA